MRRVRKSAFFTMAGIQRVGGHSTHTHVLCTQSKQYAAIVHCRSSARSAATAGDDCRATVDGDGSNTRVKLRVNAYERKEDKPSVSPVGASARVRRVTHCVAREVELARYHGIRDVTLVHRSGDGNARGLSIHTGATSGRDGAEEVIQSAASDVRRGSKPRDKNDSEAPAAP
jgi:hypothetical protein